jgi:hypothetical protein
VSGVGYVFVFCENDLILEECEERVVLKSTQAINLNRYFLILIALCFYFSKTDLSAQCVALSSAYHLTGTAAAGSPSPAGDSMITTNTGTANGFTPTSVLSSTPLYWYSGLISGLYNSGTYTFTLWTNSPGAASIVTVQLGYSNQDGTGSVVLGTASGDVNASGAGNHTTGFTFNVPVLNFTNKVFWISITQTSGTAATIVYNDGTDFDTFLSTTVGQSPACPTWTPTPCGYTSQTEIDGTGDKVMYIASQSTADPTGWNNLGYNDSAWSNAAIWTSPTGPGIGGVPWASWEAAGAGNGADKELVLHSFTIPAGAIGISGTLSLAVDDNSTSYMNGTLIQSDTPESTFVSNQVVRNFPIPAGSMTAGSNVLAIENGDSVPVFMGYNFQLVIYYTIPCVTPTNTYTSTPTPTFTNTKTATPTPTFSNTNTNTDTSTFTNTATNTATKTATSTFTLTFTNTDSSTFTNTATMTSTNSQTNTATMTATATFTNTLVNTVTQTNTDTNTATSTLTNTDTNTATATATATFTNTLINTATQTNTATNTFTASFTNTYTNTMTQTATATFTNTFINTPTFTNTFTNTDTSTFTSTFTSTPTNTMTFTATSTATFTNTHTMTDTPTTSNTPTKTFTNTDTPTTTNTLTSTFTPTITPTFTWTSTPTPVGAFTVRVNVYNSAGEVVKTIEVVHFAKPVNSLDLPSGNVITTLTGSGSTVELYFEGVLIGSWDGSNNSGNPVSNGAYEVKVDNIDPSGVVTSVSQQVVVNRDLTQAEVNIFNSAGEIVKKLYQTVSNSSGSEMTNVNLSSNVLNPGVSKFSGETGIVQILVMTSGSPITLEWDGTSDSGKIVTPGVYVIEVHWNNGQGSLLDITRDILVASDTGSGAVVARPNELISNKGTMTTTFDGTAVANAASLKVEIHTLTGQLIAVVSNSPGTVTAPWNASGAASGIYIAVVSVLDAQGNTIHQQRLKVLVIH